MNKKLGYYLVDGIEFSSKIEACIYATKQGKTVEWIFNNDVFSNHDWKIEPEETLDQLYDKRARELREMYDYLIISYSAGADSHNLLSAFLRQGLTVDEIIVNTMSKGNENYSVISSSNFSSKNSPASEHVLQAIPRLREISNNYPGIKITVIDLTDYLFDSFRNSNDASWVLNKRESLNPINSTRYNYIYFSEVRKKFDKDKKIAVILGVEKPRVFINSNNDSVFVLFNDRAANITSVEDHIADYSNVTIEYFYWHPSCAKMICKQAHVIKKWLEAFPENQKNWISPDTNNRYRLIHERVYRTLIYTTWDNSWYQADKSTSDWYNEFDSWFLEGYKTTTAYRIWQEGLGYVKDNAYNFIMAKNGIEDGLINFYKTYHIGPLKKDFK